MPNTRTYNWRHTALIGSALRGRADMQRIINSKSVIDADRDLAYSIAQDMLELARSIRKYRVNQDGSISIIKDKR